MGDSLLNQRQRDFCLHYLKDQDLAAAVRAAGYKCQNPKTYGKQLLKKSSIQQFLAIQKEALAMPIVTSKKSTNPGADEVLCFFNDLMRGCVGQEGEIKISERLKAAEAIAKILGLYNDKSQKEKQQMKVEIIDDI